jgi:sulfur carrier protein ThiS
LDVTKNEGWMNITVFLHTTLQRQFPKVKAGKLSFELPPGSTLEDLIRRLHIKLDIQNTLLVVNGRNVELDHVLLEDDQVHLIPAISGG